MEKGGNGQKEEEEASIAATAAFPSYSGLKKLSALSLPPIVRPPSDDFYGLKCSREHKTWWENVRKRWGISKEDQNNSQKRIAFEIRGCDLGDNMLRKPAVSTCARTALAAPTVHTHAHIRMFL